MNWYHRAERRYVEYGSSFRASQQVGFTRQLTDTVYNMNGVHLSREVTTVFEALDDDNVRTAGTTYLMYRGRHRHEPQRDSALTRLASTLLRHSVMGPRELFYADIFASRRTGCRSTLGMPGVRDRHSGCVGAYLVEHDLFDFLLLSLPDNDWHSHRAGPDGQTRSIALADLQLARVMQAGGGIEKFLEEHAVIVMADHSQVPITTTVSLQEELAELGVLTPAGARTSRRRASGRRGGGEGAEHSAIAVCPSQRAAMVYILDAAHSERLRDATVRLALGLDGVDLVMWLHAAEHAEETEAVIARPVHGELRFRPGGEVLDVRGRHWSVDGNLEVLDATIADGRLHSCVYPDALDRVWSALTCPSSGEILLSAAPGYEFCDWGGQAHVGGGSHGSLRAEDSLGALIVCGIEPVTLPEQWTIRDVARLVTDHFGP
jgi:hypothetical protein